MFEGRVLAIAIAREARGTMEASESIDVVHGKGLAGDRYAESKKGQIRPGQQVTFIEQEAIDGANREYDLSLVHLETRRNVLTEGVPLNHLIGKDFRVGAVVLRGAEMCEPCGYLEGRTYPGVEKALRHRGGLRAEVIEGGRIAVGDVITATS